MTLLQFVAGMVLLLAGGEALVRGAVVAATRLGVSPHLIGLTLVGFGTSTPELVASVNAALIGAPGIAIGNVVGSNIANVLLILGTAAVIYPIATAPHVLRRDGLVMMLAVLALVAIVLAGHVSRPIGIGLLAALAVYTVTSFVLERRPDAAPSSAPPGWPYTLPAGMALAVGGIVAVVLGAKLLVGAAVTIASGLGVSEAVIGLTIVAVGTSLPELVTSVTAALRRQTELAFGNVIGSNIFNVFGILGVTAIVQPIGVPPEIVRFDVWAMLLSSVLLLVFAASRGGISRQEGALLLALYAVYLGVQFSPAARSMLGL